MVMESGHDPDELFCVAEFNCAQRPAEETVRERLGTRV